MPPPSRFAIPLICASLLTTGLLGAPCRAEQGAPPEYIEAAHALAEPLYPPGFNRPDLDLKGVLEEEAPRLAFFDQLNPAIRGLSAPYLAARAHAVDSAVALMAIAEIDDVRPSNMELFKRGVDALGGDQDAQDRFDGTLGGVIVAELFKAGLRSVYRDSLVGRRNAAWQLWEAADEYDGPQFIQGRAGIGIQVQEHPSGAQITEVLPGTPAEEAGLEAGDLIYAVDGRQLPADDRQNAAIEAITGAPGTQVTIQIVRHLKRLSYEARREVPLPAAALAVDFNSSWGGSYSNAVLAMRNIAGCDLTNVTLFVAMRRADGQAIGHTHFVRHWVAGERLDAHYFREGQYNAHEDLDGLVSIDFTLMCDEGWAQQTYVYAGVEAERDADVLMSQVQFSAAYLPAETYLFSAFDESSGLSLSFEGKEYLPVNSVTITLSQGRATQVLRWTPDGLRGTGTAFRDARFDRINPDQATVVMTLPGCGTSWTESWQR